MHYLVTVNLVVTLVLCVRVLRSSRPISNAPGGRLKFVVRKIAIVLIEKKSKSSSAIKSETQMKG